MTNNEIITELARERIVEQIARNVCPRMGAELLADLAQDVYLALLKTDNDKLCDLYEHGTQINYYIVRIIKNNLSQTGNFNMSQLRWENKRTDITPSMYEDTETL